MNDKRDVILSFRVTQDEKKLIEEKALSSYRLVSMYLRDCALDKKITVIDGLKETETQLRKIGNNLNQLTTDRRPEFQKMIADAADKIFDIVLVHKLDRFARNRYDSIGYRMELKKNGVSLIA